MNPSEPAIIRWSPDRAGRVFAPPAGYVHRGAAVFEEQDMAVADAWSVVVRVLRELDGPRCVVADVAFLMDHAPHELLSPGHRFRMVGGSCGKGVMMERQLALPERVSEFELALIG